MDHGIKVNVLMRTGMFEMASCVSFTQIQYWMDTMFDW